MKKIISYLKEYQKKMILGLVIKVLGTFMDLGLPWVLAYIIDDVTPKKEIPPILLWGLVMILLAVGARQFNIKANQMASKVARDATEEIRKDLFEKVLSMSSAQIDEVTIPSLVTRLTSDTYIIHQMIGMMQRIGVRAPIILVGGIIITMTLEPVLSLIILMILPLLGLCVYYISKKGIPLFEKTQKANDQMVRVVRENITGIRVIKALSKTEYETERFSNVNRNMADNELHAQNTMAVTGPLMNLLLNIGLTLVIVVGAFRVNGGYSEVGKIVAFLSYFTIMLQAVMAITRIFVILSKANASAQRISVVLDGEEDLKVLLPQEIEVPSARLCDGQQASHIEFRNVSFSYDKKGEVQCLKDISFSLKKGESLGIIGATGAGKTTIINLLMRFYDVDQGQVLIDGKDVRTIPLQELRKRFGAVFQNDTLFAQSIAENIDFHRTISREKVEQTAGYAQAAEFIQGIEDGYDHMLAPKGVNLSGGQKQRVLISRALAKQPEILILDDSSSALDYQTDARLRKELRSHYLDTTMIMVAQRISSIMSLSKILVIEDGEMIGYGTHDELLESCDLYREIYRSQMGEELGLNKTAKKGGEA